jgi:hypothetical protein
MLQVILNQETPPPSFRDYKRGTGLPKFVESISVNLMSRWKPSLWSEEEGTRDGGKRGNNDKGKEREVSRPRPRHRHKERERRAPIDPSHYLAGTSHRTIYKSLIMQRLTNRQTVVSSATGWQWRMGGQPGCRARGRANTAAIFVSAYLRHYFISIFPPFRQLWLSNSSLVSTHGCQTWQRCRNSHLLANWHLTGPWEFLKFDLCGVRLDVTSRWSIWLGHNP